MTPPKRDRQGFPLGCRCWGVQHIGNIVANLYQGRDKNGPGNSVIHWFLSGLHCIKVQRNLGLIESSFHPDLQLGGVTISYLVCWAYWRLAMHRQDEKGILWLEALFVVVIEWCLLCAFTRSKGVSWYGLAPVPIAISCNGIGISHHICSSAWNPLRKPDSAYTQFRTQNFNKTS
jgi:hypothetical protein